MNTMTNKEPTTREILSSISTEELIAELDRRTGVVCSIWTKIDVLPLIDQDDRFADFDEETRDDIAIDFLETISGGLLDILGERGNDYTADKLEELADELASSHQKDITP